MERAPQAEPSLSEVVQQALEAPPASAPSIEITEAIMSGNAVSVTVKLTPGIKGAIHLMLLYAAEGSQPVPCAQCHILAPSEEEMRSHTFQNIDTNKWTGIHVIATIYRHRGAPKVKRLK